MAKKSQIKYMSPENQNEILEIMANHVIKKTLSFINKSPCFILMVYETTDVSNKEQLTVVIRWIDERFEASEDF